MPNSKPKPKFRLPARPKQKFIPHEDYVNAIQQSLPGDDEPLNPIITLTLENNHRYAHTASCSYQLTMASLQPDNRRLPNCGCNVINEEKRGDKNKTNDHRVTVIVEHNLNEHILCILDSKKLNQCKLSLIIQPGEQIAFRTVGKIPVQLTGFIMSDDR